MRLIIAEKPELGRAIAKAILPGTAEKDGMFEHDGTVIIWCFGHMLSLKEPQEIRSGLERWTEESLPIFFHGWPKKISEGKEQRVKQIFRQMDRASEIVNAGDPDDEGQSLIDELIEYHGFSGKISRVLINDNLPENIQKAFNDIRDNDDFTKNGTVAYARQMADMAFGINHSRLASIRMHNRLSIGRVQTPTLGLVVRRDELIDSHIKQKYFSIEAVGCANGSDIELSFKPEEGHPESRNEAEDIIRAIPRRVKMSFSEKGKVVNPPLPYNLAVLQAEMNKKHGYSLKDTMKITQELRDDFQAITYNRSDSQYLNETHYEEAEDVLSCALDNIGKSYPLDYGIRSKCFNDANVTAHHAIIPQRKRIDMKKMNTRQRNVYEAIVERYAMQFLPPRKLAVSSSSLDMEGGKLIYSATRVVDEGFRKHFREEKKKQDEKLNGYVPSGEHEVTGISARAVEKETRPLPRYTPATLVKDMTSVAKYVTDKKIRQILLEKDKGKKGEKGSIGTSATRSDIVESLIRKGYLMMDKKNIVSTELGKSFFHALSPEIASPDVTARWWLIQEEIRNGKKSPDDLLDEVIRQFNAIRGDAYRNVSLAPVKRKVEPLGKCPVCGGDILPGKGKNGMSFYCSNYKEKSCRFRLYENMKRFRDCGDEIHIDEDAARRLLEGGRIRARLEKKDGSMINAYVRLELRNGYASFAIDGFPKRKKNILDKRMEK